jgi:hypothetical protein
MALLVGIRGARFMERPVPRGVETVESEQQQ